MSDPLEQHLSALSGTSVDVKQVEVPDEHGQASVAFVFSDGTRLSACYWRVSRSDTVLSSFDHKQTYGLPSTIDAQKELRSLLAGAKVISTSIDRATGDLHLNFSGGWRLEVFGFSGYEVWEISFADGSSEYSNYVRR
jgi:hypothetical protein